jgi:hypothetical protein
MAAVLLAALIPAAAAADGDLVVFIDPDFEDAVREAIRKPEGWITKGDVDGVKELDVSWLGIESLSGIEHFTALETLDCSGNELIRLDTSKNTLLRRLDCNFNNLATLNILKNTELRYLDCEQNRLEGLDTSGNPALVSLNCRDNLLTALELENNKTLRTLDCGGNHLKELDTSVHPALSELYCDENALTFLDTGSNQKLMFLACDSNELTEIDVTQNTLLLGLSCRDNVLSNLNVSAIDSLTVLDCGENLITELRLNSYLMALDCSFNWLTSLDLRDNFQLELLICNNNYLPGKESVTGLRDMMLLLDDNTLFEPQYESSPPDLSAVSPWALRHVKTAIRRGLIPDGLLSGFQNPVTRLEFCRFAMNFIKAETGKPVQSLLAQNKISVSLSAFTDTKDMDALIAYALGIVSETGDKTFNPGGQVRREDAAVMLMNLRKALGYDVSAPPSSGFADAANIAPGAEQAVDYCVANGIMSGGETFNPKGLITREMCIMMFANMR